MLSFSRFYKNEGTQIFLNVYFKRIYIAGDPLLFVITKKSIDDFITSDITNDNVIISNVHQQILQSRTSKTLGGRST